LGGSASTPDNGGSLAGGDAATVDAGLSPYAGTGGTVDAALQDAGSDTGDPVVNDAGQTTPLNDGSVDVSSCPPPPDDATPAAVEAWTLVNEFRLPAGAGCMNMVAELNTSAQLHCDYRAANSGNAGCTPDGHTEVMGCIGFTGETVGDREVAAGYPQSLAYTETSYSYNNPAIAIPGWLATVWHRIPLIDPWSTDMGYGGGPRCDIIDIGRGMASVPTDTIAVYPYDGQINVPPSWSGREAPSAPAPPSGFPSSYPINIYAKDISITEHIMTKDGDDTPLEHLFVDASTPAIGYMGLYLSNTVFIYGAPFEANTKYRVRMVGTYAGGALNVEWSFTTGASNPFGF
jgi:hypothetical protein